MTPNSQQTFSVIRPGLLTTIQDLGRTGYQRFGMPVSGAMDPLALRIANRLVGNSDQAACLEITLQGPELLFETDSICAITGGDLSPTLNQKAIPMWKPFAIQAGDTLSFGTRKHGARSYLALPGGLDVPMKLGSRSTHLRSHTGGLKGRALRKQDVLRSRLSQRTLDGIQNGTIPLGILNLYQSISPIRVILGPHSNLFKPDAVDVLQQSTYRVTPQSDRMGYRLAGPSLTHLQSSHIISEAVPLGALQVPENLQPILLMADRQTTGGYPILAVVMSADIPRVAQLMPGESIQFQLIDLQEAQFLLQEQRKFLDKALPAITLP